jgi:tetratricopeptide (TPR) repeat protein
MIKHKAFNIFLVILVSAATVSAQKVKYKDIYALLSTKQYEQAEPFLRSYLKETTDNPNAYLFMGLVYQEKSSTTDVLLETERAIEQMDSAVIFLSKAAQSITEKELKKNDEYYTAYNRRDLRTGEFGVKLSDVQLDLENRMTSLRERIDKVKMVKHYFTNSEELYKRSLALFQEIQSAFPGTREMYLRSDEAMIEKIRNLSLRFDSCTKMFEHYKVSMSNLGKTKYNQSWTLRDIENFKNDGTEPSDFYSNDLKVWDYKKFANSSLTIIEKEVVPTLNDLVTYDIEINKLRHRMESDSVSVKNDLVKLIEKLLNNQLKKFDSDPMPMSIFSLKIADLEYKSTVIENKPVMSSTDLTGKLEAVRKEVHYINKLDSIANNLFKRPLDEDILNYQKFVITTFSKGDILKSYIRSIKEYAARESEKKKLEVASYQEALNWLVVGSDSIPLIADATNSKYRPVLVEENKYTVGATFSEKVSGDGYFYNINPSRIPSIKAIFPLDSGFSVVEVKNSLKALVATDAGEQIYFAAIYGTASVKGKYRATVAKIYKSDGLSWNSNIKLDFIPASIEMVPDTGELRIKSETEGINVLLDKNGKIKPK